jgi:hypothetical protein
LNKFLIFAFFLLFVAVGVSALNINTIVIGGDNPVETVVQNSILSSSVTVTGNANSRFFIKLYLVSVTGKIYDLVDLGFANSDSNGKASINFKHAITAPFGVYKILGEVTDIPPTGEKALRYWYAEYVGDDTKGVLVVTGTNSGNSFSSLYANGNQDIINQYALANDLQSKLEDPDKSLNENLQEEYIQAVLKLYTLQINNDPSYTAQQKQMALSLIPNMSFSMHSEFAKINLIGRLEMERATLLAYEQMYSAHISQTANMGYGKIVFKAVVTSAFEIYDWWKLEHTGMTDDLRKDIDGMNKAMDQAGGIKLIVDYLAKGYSIEDIYNGQILATDGAKKFIADAFEDPVVKGVYNMEELRKSTVDGVLSQEQEAGGLFDVANNFRSSGQIDRALEVYSTITTAYSQTSYASQAQQKIKDINKFFTGEKSLFYYKNFKSVRSIVNSLSPGWLIGGVVLSKGIGLLAGGVEKGAAALVVGAVGEENIGVIGSKTSAVFGSLTDSVMSSATKDALKGASSVISDFVNNIFETADKKINYVFSLKVWGNRFSDLAESAFSDTNPEFASKLAATLKFDFTGWGENKIKSVVLNRIGSNVGGATASEAGSIVEQQAAIDAGQLGKAVESGIPKDDAQQVYNYLKIEYQSDPKALNYIEQAESKVESASSETAAQSAVRASSELVVKPENGVWVYSYGGKAYEFNNGEWQEFVDQANNPLDSNIVLDDLSKKETVNVVKVTDQPTLSFLDGKPAKMEALKTTMNEQLQTDLGDLQKISATVDTDLGKINYVTDDTNVLNQEMKSLDDLSSEVQSKSQTMRVNLKGEIKYSNPAFEAIDANAGNELSEEANGIIKKILEKRKKLYKKLLKSKVDIEKFRVNVEQQTNRQITELKNYYNSRETQNLLKTYNEYYHGWITQELTSSKAQYKIIEEIPINQLSKFDDSFIKSYSS